MLKLLFVLFISIQSAVAYNPEFVTLNYTTPELDTKVIDGKSLYVLKGDDKLFTGISKRLNNEGLKEAEAHFNEGALSFDKVWSENNGTYSVSHFKDGLVQTFELFNNDNSIRYKEVFEYKDGMIGALIYENGINPTRTEILGKNETAMSHILSEVSVFDKSKKWDSKGRKAGLWIEKYDDGSIFKKKRYLHGKPTGIWESWHSNGNKQAEINFVGGLLNGPFRFWNEDGLLVVDGQLKDSYEVGNWTFKDNNGNEIDRPEDLHINITDEGETIAVIGHDNKEIKPMEYYVSIQMPLAMALLVLLPLLGAGITWLVMKRKKKVDVI